MRIVCTAATMRIAEARAGVAEPVLMQRAATGLAGVCRSLLRQTAGRVAGARVVALVGSGNNGGDALWAAAKLADRGVGAIAIGDPDRMHAPGLAALQRAGGRVLAWDDPAALGSCASADLALDGIVGIGGSGALRAGVAPLLAALEAAAVPIVAVDIPSGVAADTGEVPGLAVRAAATVTFGALKAGLALAPGRQRCGLVTVIDIGLAADDLAPAALVTNLADLAGPPPAPNQYKYSRGVVQVTAGSMAYPGAAHLAVQGARGSGAGMVALHAGPGADPLPAVSDHPDVVVSPDPVFARADARVLGPGLPDTPAALTLLQSHLADSAPLVVDASGLTALATPAGRAALADRHAAGWLTVVTPHEGEFARLGFDLAGGRLAAAERAAQRLGAVVVLKGPGTVVAAPDGSVSFIDTFGGPELATAGSGDVLAGLIAGTVAGQARRAAATAPLDWAALTHAAARAVGLHGLAGRLAAAASGAVTASDVAAALPRAALLAQQAAGQA